MTEYEKLTQQVSEFTQRKRIEQISYWYENHIDEDDHTSLLTEDLFCECCGVDYSGFNRDLLDNDFVPPVYGLLDI